MALPEHIEAALARVAGDEDTCPADADLLREYIAGTRKSTLAAIVASSASVLKAFAAQAKWIAIGTGGTGLLAAGGAGWTALHQVVDETDVHPDADDAAPVPVEDVGEE